MKDSTQDWEKDFREKYSIKVTVNEGENPVSAFLLEKYWQFFPIGEMVEDIKLLIERGRLQGIEEAKGRLGQEIESKNGAYRERNMLVCALTKLFPAYLARHDENDMDWERDWMWIVYIDLPTGQVSWHLHDSEVVLFKHLEIRENKWDGHNTERKYERLLALDKLKGE